MSVLRSRPMQQFYDNATGKIIPEGEEAIRRHLKDRSATCPCCGNKDDWMVDERSSLVRVVNWKRDVSFPVAVAICQACGFLMHFAPSFIGKPPSKS